MRFPVLVSPSLRARTFHWPSPTPLFLPPFFGLSLAGRVSLLATVHETKQTGRVASEEHGSLSGVQETMTEQGSMSGLERGARKEGGAWHLRRCGAQEQRAPFWDGIRLRVGGLQPAGGVLQGGRMKAL